ncbi:MAG TPA: MraY family glycosyltransferase [Balneolaceae bacterium]|nr:MraY family glycosyltransferase [Balneolaceae bacterium]
MSAFIITWLFIPRIIKISYEKNLCDDPSIDQRKLHIHATPTLGGVAIFAAILFTFLIGPYALQTWTPYLIAGLIVLFFSGIKDDIFTISPLNKLIFQILAVALLIIGDGLVITDLGGVFGFHQIPYWPGFLLTMFTMIVVINSYNLIDGVDGLAGGVGVIASTFFAWWFWQTGMMAHAVLAIALTGSLLAFLRFNFSPASIFMGDTGSQVVGFLLVFLAVSFVKTGVEATGTIPFGEVVPVLVLSVLIVPLYDTLRVFLMRTFRKQSPFHADRLHVHHQLLDMGLTHKSTCYIIFTFNLAIIGLTIWLPAMNINFLFVIVLLSAVALFPTFHLKRKTLSLFGISFPSKKNIKKTGQARNNNEIEREERIAV